MIFALANFLLVLLVLALWVYRLHGRMDDLADEFDSVREQAADAWVVSQHAWEGRRDR